MILLEFLNVTRIIGAYSEERSRRIQVNLDSSRRFHAPEWTKTVTTALNNHGTWSSASLRYATSYGFSEPRQPGCVPTKLQRILVPAQDGVSVTGQGRPLNQTYDPEIIKLWHAKCFKTHAASCHPESGKSMAPFPARLRLIDVHRWRIVSVAPGLEPDYVALSYVWGASDQPRLSSKTTAKWPTTNALRRRVDLPQIIQDAIQVVGEIGMRFLWADALCIVQDVEEEQAIQIRQMDRIYSRASLTLVSTSRL